jgi:UDP-glucose 4-epimerase
MKALVTGATGFIGLKLIKNLEDCGYSIRILSRNNNLDYDTVICDLQNEKIPESALDSIDVIFHLAGHTLDLASDSIQEKIYYDVNVGGTVKLIKIAVKKKVRKFIYVSSVKAGGVIDENKCISESDQSTPNDIYGITKREAEIEVLRMSEQYDIHVSIIRPALVYGEKMKGNLANMFNGIKSGWFPPLPEVYNKRSMIHISDLISAMLLIARDSRTNGQIYIATDGYQYSSRSIYKAICSATGKKIPAWIVPKSIFYILAKIGDVVKFFPFNSYKYKKIFGNEYYSSEKLNNLGFSPKYNLFTYLERYDKKE